MIFDDERFAEGDDAQLWICRNRPTDYARIAATIDVCMALGDRPCRGGDCDEDAPCQRHQRTTEIAARVVRMRAKRRAERKP